MAASPEAAGPTHPEPMPGPAARAGLAVACVALAAGLGRVVLDLPADAAGLAPAVSGRLAESGVDNPVTAVLLNFRGYDTLLETGVLLLALIGVWSLTPAGCWGGVPGPPARPGQPPGDPDGEPDPVLRGFVRWLAPVAVLVAAYLLAVGTHSPGGAFQAGTVLAAAAVLLLLAGMARPPATASLWPRLVAVAGFLAFVAAALAGMPGGREFLEYPPGLAGTLIELVETVLTLAIGATLALLVAGGPEPPAVKPPPAGPIRTEPPR
jgi:multisubunit Na+/H+ antiporter MnhB subunit